MNYLGIDTSAYTTSIAIVDDQRNSVWEKRRIINVPLGKKGLAQSEAFFQHVQTLPKLIAEIPGSIWDNLAGVGVSMKPRPIEGSYMPVFTAGYAVAQSIASAKQIPLTKTSHQEGHLTAGLASAGGPTNKEFLALHLSGGTTELLLINRERGHGYDIKLLGGTNDLHAGQFVDRIGVRLGLSFPAGEPLEILARSADPDATSLLPSSVHGLEVSFSGVETAAQRLIDQGTSRENVARAVEGCIARTVVKLILAGMERHNLRDVLIVGGVSSNLFIREEIERRLSGQTTCYWADPIWSSDNALGVALLAQEASKS